MGLDAWVHCDCFEKGRLKTPLPTGLKLLLEDAGGLYFQPDEKIKITTNRDELRMKFDLWRLEEACEHPRMKLIEHRLGNISLIGLLRHELSRLPGEYPVLLQKVIYSGSHAGDFLPIEFLPALELEVQKLQTHPVEKHKLTKRLQTWWPGFGRSQNWKLPSERTHRFLVYFQKQIEELIEAAMTVKKPICF
jgi:hypothetical protein